MASYDEEHNLGREPEPPRRRAHDTLSQQALTDFFSMSGSDQPRAARPEDFSSLASALNGLNHDSPVVQQLVEQLMQDQGDESLFNGTKASQGVSQTYLDSLDRIPTKRLKADDECAICATKYLSDPYPLVVRLPCHTNHHFDLECIGPWLKVHSTCPMCRKDLLAKKEVVYEDSEEEYDDTYA